MTSPPRDNADPSPRDDAALDIWLIRHAESLGNLDHTGHDTPLSPAGERQALALRPLLAPLSFDAVYTSPLLRARQSCHLALPHTPPQVNPLLTELVTPPDRGFIDISQMPASELQALLSQTQASRHAETGLQFNARIQRWRSLLPRSGRALAFTHFAVIRALLSLDVGFRGSPQRIAYTGIFRLSIRADGALPLMWNDTEHLKHL